jgi:hypothetical protein
MYATKLLLADGSWRMHGAPPGPAQRESVIKKERESVCVRERDRGERDIYIEKREIERERERKGERKRERESTPSVAIRWWSNWYPQQTKIVLTKDTLSPLQNCVVSQFLTTVQLHSSSYMSYLELGPFVQSVQEDGHVTPDVWGCCFPVAF